MTAFFSEVVLPAFATFFVIIDPLGLAPVFVALTLRRSLAERRRIATNAVLLAAGVLLLFAFLGEAILKLFGITLPAFRIAGGLLLFMIAAEMLFEKRTQRRRQAATSAEPPGEYERVDDAWVFPLGIPLIAGPGAITSAILLMGQHKGDVLAQAAVIGTILLVLLITWLLFRIVSHAERFLSATAIGAISRLLGIILAALAVQFVLAGLKGAGLLS